MGWLVRLNQRLVLVLFPYIAKRPNDAVSPAARHNYVKCIAGENLYISLEGMELADADLSFSGEYANVTLVRWMGGGREGGMNADIFREI